MGGDPLPPSKKINPNKKLFKIYWVFKYFPSPPPPKILAMPLPCTKSTNPPDCLKTTTILLNAVKN